MSPFKSVEAAIQEAIQRGDFNNLPGRGKPVDLTDYFNTPEDVRITFSILRNANMLPDEVDLLKEIASLKEQQALCMDTELIKTLQKMVDERLLKYNLLMDARYKK